MTPQQIRALIEEFTAARNAGDREAIARLVTDDVEHVLPRSIGRPPVRGEAVVDGISGGLVGQFFDVSTIRREVTRVIVEGNVAAVEQTMTGTTLKGKRYVNDYVWIYELRDGKIARMIEHLDTLNGRGRWRRSDGWSAAARFVPARASRAATSNGADVDGPDGVDLRSISLHLCDGEGQETCDMTGGRESMTVSGTCDPRFERVREEFERNFAERGELGASVCAIVDGEPVVDLWGGVADPDTGAAWERDTMNVVMSATKGAAALCAHMLIDRGQLDLEAPIASYWPEFAKHGKGEIPVRMALNHQSGVAHVTGEVPEDGLNDWELMVRLIEDTEPFWTPGEIHGYHGQTIGYLVGELVRRIDGRSIGTFFREEVAEPLGIDLWIGAPQEQHGRISRSHAFELTGDEELPPFFDALLDPASLPSRIHGNLGGWFPNFDKPATWAAEIPSAGGVGNARGLAGMYAPLSLGGAIGDVRLVSEAAIPRMRIVQSAGHDAVLLVRTAYTLGFAKSWPDRGATMTIGEDAFGVPGLGGQIGFADPTYGLAFAYTMNRHGVGTALNARGQSLIDATYEILGSPSCEPGHWVRPREQLAGRV